MRTLHPFYMILEINYCAPLEIIIFINGLEKSISQYFDSPTSVKKSVSFLKTTDVKFYDNKTYNLE